MILPQAISLSLPALVNELILLVKASSLVSVVGILEITRSSQALAATTFRPLEVYLAAACIYLAINLCLAGARPLPRAQDGRLMDLSIFAQYGPMLSGASPSPSSAGCSARSSAWRSGS